MFSLPFFGKVDLFKMFFFSSIKRVSRRVIYIYTFEKEGFISNGFKSKLSHFV